LPDNIWLLKITRELIQMPKHRYTGLEYSRYPNKTNRIRDLRKLN